MQPLSMADLQGQLNQVATQADQKQKLEAYKQLLHALMAAPSITSFNAFIDHSKALCALHKAPLDAADPPTPAGPLAVVSDEVPLVISRQVIQLLAQELRKTPPDVHKPVAQQ